MNFEKLNLSKSIIDALATDNITTPTSIQIQAIPLILQNKNIVLQSQTGSGKTLAYLLPIYQKQPETIAKGASTVVVAPTRELAMQVHHEVQDLSDKTGIPLKSVTLFGNVNINSQIEKLKEKPQIIIGTTDRILTLIQNKKLSVHTVSTLIVDEADKLLDKQSISTLKQLRKKFMKNIQTVFVSATYSQKDLQMLREVETDFEIVQTVADEKIPSNISHYFIKCDKRDKLEVLRKLIAALKPEKSMVFINELDQIDVSVEKLNFHKYPCKCIHSNISKQQRQKTMADFSSSKLKTLVATDLAARGLHVDDISCVFSVSISENPADYLHRAGRCGRNGASGTSICIVTPNETQFINKYKSKHKIKFYEIKMQNGEVTLIDDDKKLKILTSVSK